MPRGSVVPVVGDRLRFLAYWRQAEWRTDFDLSALLLDDDFAPAGHLSWTNLTTLGGVHSGDITEAPEGASEFIEIDLSTVQARYIVPQVLVYAGEGFDEVAESFFGFMGRDGEQHGRPDEPRTVRYAGQALDGPVTYLGIERPADLPAGSDAITLDRLAELVPG